MNNFLLTLAGALILALAALFVGPYFVDWNSYRTVFEEQATRLAGRPVSVEGNVNLRLLPAPYVSFERVRIAGDATGTTTPLLEIDNYTLWLAVPPLLQGEIEAQAMAIDRPSLRLEVRPDGSVNWSGLGQGSFELPFVPRNVAFRDTNISGGSIEIHGADGKTLTQISDISGTFTARALTGPFKFIGTIGTDENSNDIRWSTGRFDESSGLRVKGTLKNKARGTTYAADGLLQRIMTQPVFTGGVAGKLRKKDRVGFEMKTDVYADTTGAQFKDITLLLDAEGRPQIINGEGHALWQDANGASAQLNLSSRWLDVDRLITADGEKKDLLARLDATQAFLASALPDNLPTRATFKATQVNFGAEALDDLVLKLNRRGGGTEVESLTANLPGAAHLALNGRLAPHDPATPEVAPAFTGKLTVRGRTLSRFASWLKPEWGTATAQVDGAFALETPLASSSNALVLEGARARLGDARLTIGLHHGRDATTPLKLTLESAGLDVSRFFPDAATLGTALRAFAAERHKKSNASQAFASTTIVNVNVGRLKVGDASYSDVALNARWISDQLDLQRVAFASTTGLEVDVTADQADVTDAERHARPLRYVLRVGSRAAYDELAQLAGVEVPDAALKQAMFALVPAHVAGSLEREPDAPAFNLRYDGTFAENPVLGRIRVEGDESDWRQRAWTVTTDVTLLKPAPLLKELGLPSSAISQDDRSQDAEVKPGRAVLHAIGRPLTGLKTNFSLQSRTVEASFSGAMENTDNGLSFDGDASGRMRAENRLAQLLALDPGDARVVTFAGKMRRIDNRTTLKGFRLAAGKAALTLEAELTNDNGVSRAVIDAQADQLALPALLALAMPAKSPATDAANVIWSEAPFDFTALKSLAVEASIRARTLRVGGDLSVSDAVLEVSGTGQEIALKTLKARAGAGTVTASAALARRPAGAEINAKAHGANIPFHILSRLTGNQAEEQPQRPSGSVSFAVSANGVGLSPKGIVSVMKGEGRVVASDASLEYFSPQVIQDVAADIAEENAEVSPDDLKARIAERLTDRSLRLGAQDVAFRIRDGALQADAIRVDTPAASIAATTFVDLAQLRLDSEWRITPKTVSGSSALPPVTVFYAGDVRNISALKPGFGVAALERELTVRRLEGNIDQLEELQSLRLKTRKNVANEGGETSSRGTLRPTIGGDIQRKNSAVDEIEKQTLRQPTPPKPKRRKRRQRTNNEALWPLDAEQPPVELRLQTPEAANPT